MDGRVICRFTSFENSLEDVQTYWSPDKSKMIWNYGDQQEGDRDSSWQLWLMNADGSHLVQVNAGLKPQRSNNPVWSTDGSKIAFSNGDDLGFWTVVYTASADGSQLRQLTAKSLEGWGSDLAWSPNGNLLVFAVGDYVGMKNNTVIYVIDAGSGSTRKLLESVSDEDITSLVWSSDSSKLSFQKGHFVSAVGHTVYDTHCTIDIVGTNEICNSSLEG